MQLYSFFILYLPGVPSWLDCWCTNHVGALINVDTPGSRPDGAQKKVFILGYSYTQWFRKCIHGAYVTQPHPNKKV